MKADSTYTYADRELSWLSFNERVLQEAEDPSVPLFERINFLAIYSSNLDEYFRVRVASLRNLLRLSDKSVAELEFKPARLLSQIQQTVERQHGRVAAVWSQEILPELRAHGIHLVNEQTAAPSHQERLRGYFDREVEPHLDPIPLTEDRKAPFLKNQQLYLVVELYPRRPTAPVFAGPATPVLVNVPAGHVPRFKVLTEGSEKQYVIFLDDIIRLNLERLFPDAHAAAAFSLTLSRDAEVYLEDEFTGNLIDNIRKGVEKREFGRPCRFLYDERTPYATIEFLRDYFDLEAEDLVSGGRYHNLRDLFEFPRFDLDELSYAPRSPVLQQELESGGSLFEAVKKNDRLVVYPYHPFKYVVEFLREAADDGKVERIWVSLYRLSRTPAVVDPLISAAQNGKHVAVFIEAKARFSEASNLYWADRLEAEGVQVLYSIPGLKVHAKLLAVERREGQTRRIYTYLSTGNFNEATARQFVDVGLFTADQTISDDVQRVFDFLMARSNPPECEQMIVSPFHMRAAWGRLIDQEIEHARQGHRAQITVKLNSLTDTEMITHLYRASRCGVDIRCLVRGICRLVPGVEGQSENIEVRSIVDRYLEHARIYWFHNRGNPIVYAGSADWMERNLNRRVEVAFPVLDEDAGRDLRTILELQWADNTKARIVDAQQANAYVPRDGKPRLRSQEAIRDYLREKQDEPVSGTEPPSTR